jgi:hypothetical protein
MSTINPAQTNIVNVIVRDPAGYTAVATDLPRDGDLPRRLQLDISPNLAAGSAFTFRVLTNLSDTTNIFLPGSQWESTGQTAMTSERRVPEPTSGLMLGTGLVGLLGYGWRRRRYGSAALASPSTGNSI